MQCLQKSRIILKMQNFTKQADGSESMDYFNNLLQKSNGVTSKAKKYVTLKNVQIQQRLENGLDKISSKQSSIKVMKNTAENDQNQIKQVNVCTIFQNTLQNQRVQRKKLVIQDSQKPIEVQQQKISSKKQINQEERLKFVKQKIRQNKLIAKRKQQLLLKQKQQDLKQKKRLQEEILKKQQEERNKRMQKTRQKIQLIEKRKQQRILQNKKTNQILKEKSKQKILADKIHQKFLSNQNIMLDQKKKKLAEIRQLHKPMEKQEIQEHIKKFQQSRLQRSRKKQLQKSNINSSLSQKNQYYRSVFHDILQKQMKQKKDEEIEQHYRLRELKQRGKKYAEQVKVTFRPEIDEKKRQQMQKRIKSSSLLSPNPIDNRLKGHQYLQFTKQYAAKFRKQTPDPKLQKILVRQEANRTQQTDYLAMSRKNNADSRLKRSATSANDFIKNIEKKNLTAQQRQQKIIEFAQGLERKARYKQKLLNSINSNQTDEDVDRLYIYAIQAKLKILQR